MLENFIAKKSHVSSVNKKVTWSLKGCKNDVKKELAKMEKELETQIEVERGMKQELNQMLDLFQEKYVEEQGVVHQGTEPVNDALEEEQGMEPANDA